MPPSARAAAAPCRLALTPLEDRLTPAVAFQFDYRYDAAGFFADPAARAALDRAGQELAGRLDSSLAAVTPGGANTWSAVFLHPTTGAELTVANPVIPADTLVVYAGGMRGTGAEAGLGGPGGYTASGGAAWLNTVDARGSDGFASWGGSLSFDTDSSWYFGADPAGRAGGALDFHSVAVHELGHVLGFGTSAEWDELVSGAEFTGPAARAAAGGSVRLSGDREHFAQGTTSGGRPVSMQPVLDMTQRVGFSDLDYAALADLGWDVRPAAAALPSTPAAVTPVAVTPAVTLTAAADTVTAVGRSSLQVEAVPADRVVLASGPTAGTVQGFTTGAGGLTPTGGAFQPFGPAGGVVRTATGDVNGDGVADWILGTGPGGGSRVRVLDGRTFADLVPEHWAFEPAFTGGVYLAAADFDGDGRAEIVVTPDQGGGPRVQVLSVAGGQVQKRADFFGLADPAFRGGARVAAGDLNRDGTPDLAVAAGFGGGPRVSLLDGRGVLAGGGRTLTADFFAFDPGLRNGAYVAIGDTNGDGYGDLVLGAGPGGGPHVLVLSGLALTTAGGAGALNRPLGNTFAGDPAGRGGVRVAVKDFDGDGTADVLAGSGVGGTLTVLSPASGYAAVAATAPFGEAGLDGVYVG